MLEALPAAVVAVLVLLVVVVVLLVRQAGALSRANGAMEARLEHFARDGERLERELREALAAGRHEAAEAARAARTEQAAAGARAAQTLATQMTGFASALEGVRAAVDQKLAGMLAEGRSGR